MDIIDFLIAIGAFSGGGIVTSLVNKYFSKEKDYSDLIKKQFEHMDSMIDKLQNSACFRKSCSEREQ